MTKIENKDLNVEMRLKAIELLNGSLQLPNAPNDITAFNFNIRIESKVDAPNKLVFVIVHIEIKNDDRSLLLGALSVSCIFEIANFDELIKIDENGKFDISHLLIETLNIISISTTRGVMFSTFKGTFLHGAVLPIIDPKQFQIEDTTID
jgi:preprotein translocase subunit SecB